MNLRTSFCVAAAACSLFISAFSARAQGTAFTYQGQLLASGNPTTGNYDFTFSLFPTSSTNSGQIGATITNFDVGVAKGLFIVTLDFGANFPGASRWLAISVRTNGTTAFTALNPLQELQPTPYAIYSSNAAVASSAVSATTAGTANSVAASNINGTVPLADLPSNLALLNSNQTFTGANTFSNAVTFNTGAGTLQVVNDNGVVPGIVASGGLATGHLRFRNGFEVWPTSTPTNGGYLDVRGTNTPNSPTITLTGNTGAIVASNVTAAFSGNGGNLTGLNASQLTSGQVPLAQLPPVITNGQSAVTLSNVTLAGVTVVSSNITSDGYPYLYYDGQNNFFAGPLAGNPTTGNDNTAIGNSALYSLTTASSNTAVGNGALFSDTTGSNNTATGNGSLNGNVTGSDNTANGYQALYSDISGGGNTAVGFHSLFSGTNASDNSGFGVGTLLANLNGNNNTAIGYQALRNVPNGSSNIALGFQAGNTFTAGESGNIDIGNNGAAGDNNTIRIGNNQNTTYIAGVINGNGNGLTNLNASQLSGSGTIPLSSLPPSVVTTNQTNANLYQAILNGDPNGDFFAGTGAGASYTPTPFYTGGANTAVGYETMTNPAEASDCTAIGYQALSSNVAGISVIGIGYQAGINCQGGIDDIFIGNSGVNGDAYTIRIGDNQTFCYIAGVNTEFPSQYLLGVGPDNQVGIIALTSDFMAGVVPMTSESDALLAVQPISFKYTKEKDASGELHYGFSPDQVERDAPELLVRNKKGKPISVRYLEMEAMLVNEFQKQHKKILQQEEEIQALKAQAAKVDALEEQLQKLQEAVQSLTKKE